MCTHTHTHTALEAQVTSSFSGIMSPLLLLFCNQWPFTTNRWQSVLVTQCADCSGSSAEFQCIPSETFTAICEAEKGEETRRGKTEKCPESEKKVERDEGRDDRGADWSKGLLSPPATPSVHVRLNPFSVLTLLMREYTSHNASCLWVPSVAPCVRSASTLHKG